MRKRLVACLVINSFTNDSRVLKECATLKKNGYIPFVIALHDNGLLEQEDVTGISVTRLRLYSRGWVKNRFVQVLKYFEWVTRATWISRAADILHCNDLSTVPVGVLVKLLLNRKATIVYDAHEYEIETNGLHGFEKKLKAWFERSLIKHVDKVLTVSDSIANEYHRLYTIQKPDVVLNCPPYQEVKKHNLFRAELGIRDDQTIFLYQGGLSRGRGIELLLEVFGMLDTDKNAIVFMGYGPLVDEIQQQAKKYNTIFYREAVAPIILLNYTTSADYGISFIEDVCLSYRYCLPNKLFEYLMAGIPVLTSNLFEMKQLVEEYGVGVVATENTVEGFIRAVNASLACDYQQMQLNVNVARKIYNWEAQESILLNVYNEL